jgi:ACS family hexuronate transporter-like MFS transporter
MSLPTFLILRAKQVDEVGMLQSSQMTPPYTHLEFSRRGAWWICGLLFLATLLNYLDRQVLALTAERIMAEFHLNKEDFGQVIAAFRYSYAAFQLGGGWIVDAIGARGIYAGAVGLWASAGVLTSFVFSIKMLVNCRFLLGAGEAFNWPCALKVTERLIRPEDRSVANGVFNSGTAAGSMIAPVLVTFLTLRFGWRSSFLVTGILGFVWILLWLQFTRRATELKGQPTSLRHLISVHWGILRKSTFWMLAVSAILINSVSYFLADWVPLYLKTERGFGFASGNYISVPIYAGLDAGNILIGIFARKLVARGYSIAAARRRALMLSAVLMSTAGGAGVFVNPYLCVACLVLTALGVAGFLVIYLTLVQDLDPAHVGASAGLLGGLGNLAYGLLSPFIGRLSDFRKTELIFVLLGFLPWFSFAAILPATRTDRL